MGEASKETERGIKREREAMKQLSGNILNKKSREIKTAKHED